MVNRLDPLDGLLEIANTFMSTKTSQDILSILVQVIARVVEVVRCSVIMVGQNESVGQVVASYENPALTALSIDLVKYPEIAEAVATGHSIFIEDVQHDVRMHEVLATIEPLNIRSILVIPIAYREQILGTLCLRTSRPKSSFTQTELTFCHTAARMAANALLGLTEQARLRKQNADLATQAAQDSLTGLFNRGSLFIRLEQMFATAARYSRPLSYLMMDLDYFKRVNDTFGHSSGDEVLQRVAQAVRQAIRKSDVAARYGGDEFAILLPETDAEGALVKAEQIRRAVQQVRVKDGDGISVSIGAATFPSPAIHTIEELISLADKALYLAKTTGRNRIMNTTTVHEAA